MYKLWDALESAKKLKWIELSHGLNNDSPYWSGIPEGTVELGKVVFDWGNPMLECVIQSFRFPGQFGTHVDFPGHFVKDGIRSERYGVQDAVFPLCVVDITDKVAEDVHYAVTARDIMDWVLENCQDGRDGFSAGFDGWEEADPPLVYPFSYKSIEHNIDAYAVFGALYGATDRKSVV